MLPRPFPGNHEAISHPSSPIDYEERQFLGFGDKPTPIPNLSRGSPSCRPLNQKSQSSGSATYYTWSPSDRVSVPCRTVSAPRNTATREESVSTAFEQTREKGPSATQHSGTIREIPKLSQRTQPSNDLSHPIGTEQIAMPGNTCGCKQKREEKDDLRPGADLTTHPSLLSCRIEGPDRPSEDQTCPATLEGEGNTPRNP